MDEEVMIAWVKDVLAPYVATAPDHVVPILILDMYRCHMMSLVVQMIQELGVEVQHIPGGCTSLCQPVDVGFNKPFNSLTPKSVLAGTKNSRSEVFLLAKLKHTNIPTMIEPFAPPAAWDLWILPIVRADPLPKGSGGGVVEGI
jgi:hypothetical protein